MTAPITALYAALLAIFLVVLGGLVVRMRIKERIAIGDGGNKAMLAAIRVHANAVENLVIFAPLVLIAQALTISSPITIFACALYFWSRAAHLVVYTLGIAGLRTLAFTGGFIAQAILALALFDLL